MAEVKRGAFLYVVLLVIGIGAGGAGVYLYQGAHRASAPAPGPEGAAPGGAKHKKILYYQAPMDPTYIRNEPGKSPMGMDLIPVYEGEEAAAEPGTVSIDPVTIQNIGVRTAGVERRSLSRTIRTVGRVDYDEKRVHHVNTKIEGWIEKLYVDFTGEEVEKGDYLLEIYSPKLVATQEEYLLALSYKKSAPGAARVPGAESAPSLARRRLELWDVPDHQIKEIEKTGRILRTLHIHSPARGTVVKKNVQEGMYVKPGMNLYTIADLSKVWVYADVYEYEMPWIELGQTAEMTLESNPGRVFRGRVSFVYPFVEPRTRTVKVRLEFENPDRSLKPDMYSNVVLKSRRRGASLVVPEEAVILSGERSIVIVARGKGKFSPRVVRLGVESQGLYEVLEGLEEGEEVVTSAHFLIDSESRLKEAISKMLELQKKDGAADKGGDKGRGGMKEMKGMDHDGMKGMKEMKHGGMKGM